MRGVQARSVATGLAIAIALVVSIRCQSGGTGEMLPSEIGEPIALPAPDTGGGGTLRAALGQRRSVREYGDASLTLAELSLLLWAAQGVTDEEGHRTAPSAGARYPFEVYLAAARVDGLEAGLYHYRIGDHGLGRVREGYDPAVLRAAALDQESVGAAAVVLILVGVVPRTAERYGERAERYVLIEGGALVQSIQLQAADLGLGSVCIGAYEDTEIQEFVGTDALPVAIVPVGRP